MSIRKLLSAVSFAALLLSPDAALAEVKIGVVLALTGPNASLGIPYRKGLELMPKEIDGERIVLIFLDDTSDPTAAVKNAQKLITDEKVDLLIGGSNSPASIAMGNVTLAEKVQQIALAPADLGPDKAEWLLTVPQPANIWIAPLVKDMKKKGVKTVAFIGFTDPWGDICYTALKEVGEANGLQIVTNERYTRTDTSVTGQILKILSTKPDAVFVGGSGTPGALPHLALSERNYTGPVYETPGVFNKDFLRLAGKSVEGVLAATGPVGAYDQLPDTNPIKKVSLEFVTQYEAINGKGTTNGFAAYSFDAGLMIQDAIPRALKKAKPGTLEFRSALRDELRNIKELVGTQGVYNFKPRSPYGVDERSAIMVRVENGEWKLVQ